MNKVILLGRLTSAPETKYTQTSEPMAITRYSLAVNRRFKRQGEPDADFFNCTAFGKTAEFAEKYFNKGQMVSIIGRLQNRSWNDQNGQKRTVTEVIVEEQYFAESKKSENQTHTKEDNQGFYPIDESIEDDSLPF